MRAYRAVDAAFIRATTIPDDLVVPPWPDLTIEDLPGWREWLRQAWELRGFADAVRTASPELSVQVDRELRDPGSPHPRRLRRLVETLVRYLLRWTTRATPFGLFAGIAPVRFATRPEARWEGWHRVVTRPDGLSLDERTNLLEQRLETLRETSVVTNNLGFARGGSWVLPCVTVEDQVLDIEVDLTAPVRLALESARQPVVFNDLLVKLTAEASEAEPTLIEAMLADLVAHRVLLSVVRPPMTVTEPAIHLSRYSDMPGLGDRVAVDMRIGCSVSLPAAVLREAENVADILVKVAPEAPGWRTYHRAFIERYGPGAAVPVRELVGETGLGFPAGFRGSFRREPRLLSSRDAALMELAQQAALDRCAEVVLDDGLIADLDLENGSPPVPHTELRVSLAAATTGDLERGEFALTVVSGARHAGVSVGRFLPLLDDHELEHFRCTYAKLPTAMPDALAVQLSGPPLSSRMTAVARAPEILPVLPLGEYCENVGVDIDDLAVTGDARRLWLVSPSQGRPVEPLLFNAVHLPLGQQPLLRFLAEITTAWSAACRPFTWGLAARKLPFLPRVCRGRSILRPAQWTIAASALPCRTEPWHAWQRVWERKREMYRVPREVLLGADDVRIRLDLDEPAHLALLRSHLDRRSEAVLNEAEGRPGWINGRAHELVIPLARAELAEEENVRLPMPASTVEHRPGLSTWLYVRLYGRGDEILTRLAGLVDDREDGPSGGWWFIRYHEPEPHLRLRIPLHSPARFGRAAERLGRWADGLRTDGLLRDYTLHTYRPETRFGSGRALAAAEAVFAADSRACVQRLTGDRQAATAAGLVAIVEGFARTGLRWFIDHVEHGGKISLHRDQIAQARCPHGDEHLRRALMNYRAVLDRDGPDSDKVLIDLLHLHHVRMIGVDRGSERYCLRLARAVAQARLAQARFAGDRP